MVKSASNSKLERPNHSKNCCGKFSVDRDIRIRHTFKYDICIYFVSLSTILHENSSSKLKTSYFSGLAYSKNERFDL